ncbi:MAG TPA: PLP-dependent aminotransferase family protein [Terracidiphilus sp.]|jgi:GntR family transcriptional regulator/MocR family aminotransferase|nr:PLP-dependent aminotransferase family protein [Terracidiphilus sp.]
MELVIPLSKNKEPFFRQIYRGLRQAILSGAFPAGERLPSTRDLAEQLGVSRTVVLFAYEQLLAEGFAIGRGGSGTYVPEGLGRTVPITEKRSTRLRLSRYGSAAADAVEAVDSPHRRTSSVRYDFAYGRSAIESFPLEMWRRILLRHARQAPVREFEYGPAAGSLVLREAICAHLRRSRAVVCDPSEVIVVNGSQQALDLVTRVLVDRGDRVAIEDPQYNGTREVLRAAGAQLVPVPVDRDGLIPSKLPNQASLVFVTPSHQFPTGAILPLARRLQLLEWARRKNSIIVENDHDGEFHYEGRPLESMQGLDTEGRIVYLGTFSRTVFPALRIGYLIVPKSLAAAFTAAKWLNDLHSATLEQETLAEFINSGTYERHLRRLRRRNAARREALLAAIHKYLGERVEVTGDGSGAHIVLWPKENDSEESVIARAASRGVGIYGISHCFLTKPSRLGFILGYSRMNEEEIREGIRLLGKAL